MPRIRRYILTLFLLLSSFVSLTSPSPPAGAHEDAVPGAIGVDERLGRTLPDDLTFLNERGEKVLLTDLIDKPTLLSLVYFGCNHTCPMFLGSIAEVLARMDLKAGKDYDVLSVSFDEDDTPALALDKKKNYIKAAGRDFPEESWRFLTGDAGNIQRLTEAVGFTVRREKQGFSHPVALIVLSGKAKIVRYLHGMTFLPFDLTMAVTEASQGRTGSPVRKALLYCYHYDPGSKRYVFDVLKVAGAVILLSLASFFIFLVVSSRKKEKGTA